MIWNLQDSVGEPSKDFWAIGQPSRAWSWLVRGSHFFNFLIFSSSIKGALVGFPTSEYFKVNYICSKFCDRVFLFYFSGTKEERDWKEPLYEEQAYLNAQNGSALLDKFTHCLLVKCGSEVSVLFYAKGAFLKKVLLKPYLCTAAKMRPPASSKAKKLQKIRFHL